MLFTFLSRNPNHPRHGDRFIQKTFDAEAAGTSLRRPLLAARARGIRVKGRIL